jgi:thymidine kinase
LPRRTRARNGNGGPPLIISSVSGLLYPTNLVRRVSEKRVEAKIQLICGPMNCGKTSELLRLRRIEFRRCQEQGLKTVLIRYAEDTRYDKKAVVTHDGLKDDDAFLCKKLEEAVSRVEDPQVIDVFIDEGQFFGDLIEYVKRWSRMGKNISVAALDAYAVNFGNKLEIKTWAYFCELFVMATELKKFCSVCRCGNTAPFSTLIKSGGPNDNLASPKKLIGGAETYDNKCLACLPKL